MPKIRPSIERLHIDEWKDWQKEAYLGIHTGFNLEPVTDARGYQYMPEPIPVYATIRPYSAFDKPAPQVEFWFPKEKTGRTIWERILELMRK